MATLPTETAKVGFFHRPDALPVGEHEKCSRDCKMHRYLCNGVEIVKAEELRLSFKEAVFVSAARHNVGDVQTVAHANDSKDGCDGQHDKQTDDDCLQ